MDQIGKVPEIKRATRSTETRETETRRKPWAPPSRLDAPRHLRDTSIDGFALKSQDIKIGITLPASSGKVMSSYGPMNILTLSPLRVMMATMPALSALEVCC